MGKVMSFMTATLLGVMLFLTTAMAAEPINSLERSGLWGYKPSGVAIRGYDPVAYFTQAAPVEGSDEFTTQWRGARWKFASRENLNLFEENPERYAPQYGGYCAYGVAQDYLVKIEPENWSILDDKLYLNYDDDVQSLWEADIPGFIQSADENFAGLVAK
jgi:YHS domain-containing protein